jgi:hypothetical protein
MKSKVLDRPMFMDVENVGIMQGFKDESEDEGYETGAMINRMPDSPEILMNNLRGDMRSVDARVEELASLVGEDVAMDTPPEILAMLQPVLAAQSGIGSLPAGMPPPMGSPPSAPVEAAMPAPEMGMMPPEMGMPPQGMPEPINMAEGGFVQSFQAGSDEEGVTPARPSPPVDPYSAQALLQQLQANRDPRALRSSYEELMPLYQEALGGGDRSASQAQMLFDIAQAGLNLAAGTDSKGKRVAPGASFASSLAAAAQGLPERIGARVGLMEQQEQGTRLAALKGAQEQTSAQQSLENKVLADVFSAERTLRDQLSLASRNNAAAASLVATKFDQEKELQRLKAQDAINLKREEANLKGLELGKDWAERTLIELTDKYKAGTLTPAQDRQYQLAYSSLKNPTEQSFTNDLGYRETIVKPGLEIAFADAAINARKEKSDTTRGAPPDDTTAAPETQAAEKDPFKGQPVIGSDLSLYKSPGQALTLFNYSDLGTGPINVGSSVLAGLPIIGEFVTANEEIPAQRFIELASNRIARALGETERFGSVEKAQILEQLKLLPSLMGNPKALRQAIIGLDNLLLTTYNLLEETANSRTLNKKTTQEAGTQRDNIRIARSLLGAPPHAFTEEQVKQLKPGDYFLWEGKRLGKVE